MDRCIKCMAAVHRKGICDICGYNNRNTKPLKPMQLAPNTVLKNRFLIGLSKSSNNIFITYIAYDLKKKTKIYIDEYLPGTIAKRTRGDSSVFTEKGENKRLFKKTKKIILNEAKIILTEDIKNLDITGAFEDNNTIYIIREYFKEHTLWQYIKKNDNVDFEYSKHITTEIIKTVDGLHKQGIICGNIMPSNIIIDSIGCIKLKGHQFFGSLSEYLPLPINDGYSPIEQYMPYIPLSEKADVYSIAAVYYAMITREKPVSAKSRKRSDTLVPPTTNGIKLKKNIENAMFNALNINPKNRTTDVNSFLAELKNKDTQRRWERVKGKYRKDYSFMLEPAFWIRSIICAIIIIMVISIIGVIIESISVREQVEQNSKIRGSEISTMAIPKTTQSSDEND